MPSATGVSLCETFETSILRCLEQAPDDRPGSAWALRQDLLACEDLTHWTSERAASWWLSPDAVGSLAIAPPDME
jgi:hypothetical protein